MFRLYPFSIDSQARGTSLLFLCSLSEKKNMSPLVTQRRSAYQKRITAPANASKRLGARIFLLITFILLAHSHSSICQRSDGQFFTPGLLIVNSPAPNTKKQPGKRITLSLEVCGDGFIPPSNTDQNSPLATAILSVNIFLVNRELNLTVKQGPQLMQSQRGSCVKKSKFVVLKCAPPGDYQLTFHELDRINGHEFYSIYSLPFQVQNPQEESDEEDVDDLAALDAECNANPAPQTELLDSRPSEQPFLKKGLTGFTIHKEKLPVADNADIHVPDVRVNTFVVEDTKKPSPPPPTPVQAPSLDLTNKPPAIDTSNTTEKIPPAQKPPSNATFDKSKITTTTPPKPPPPAQNQNQPNNSPLTPTRTEQASPQPPQPQARPLPPTKNNLKEGQPPISVVRLKSTFHDRKNIGVNPIKENLNSEVLQEEEFLLTPVMTAKMDLKSKEPDDSPNLKLNSQDLFKLQSEPNNGSKGADTQEGAPRKPTEQMVFSVPLIASSRANLNLPWSFKLFGSIYLPWTLYYSIKIF